MKEKHAHWLPILLLLGSLPLTADASAGHHNMVKIDWHTPARAQRMQPILLSQRHEAGGQHRPKGKPQESRRHSNKHSAKSVKQAADIAQKQHGGKVLKVDRKADGYRVKMLRDGRVSYVKVPAS